MLGVYDDMVLLSSMDHSVGNCSKQLFERFICIADVAIHQALVNLGLKEVSSLSCDTLLYGFFIGFHGHSGFIFLDDQEWYLIMLDLKEYLI